MSKKINEDAPTNSAGSGAVHGIGVGPQGEPGGKSAMMKKLLSRIKRKRRNSK